MVIPFGFSAGDFVAGIHLLHKVIVALRESDDASSQYNYTLLELEGLQSLLRNIQQLQPSEICEEHINKLRFLCHQCHLPLASFFNKVKAIEKDLVLGPASPKTFAKYAKQNFRKLQWGIGLKKQVDGLKAAIAPQLASINILLQLIALEQHAKDVRSQDAFQQTAIGVFSKIESLTLLLDEKLDGISEATSSNGTAQAIKQLETSVNVLHQSFQASIDALQQGKTAQSPHVAVGAGVGSGISTTEAAPKSNTELLEIKALVADQNALIQQLTLIASVPAKRTSQICRDESRAIVVRIPSGSDLKEAVEALLNTLYFGLNGLL